MKTRLNRTFAWMAAVMTVLTGGCVEPGNPTADASTNTVEATASASAGSGTNATVAATQPQELPVLRSGRAQRLVPDEVSKVIELVEAGAGEEVIRAYVAKSSIPYELSLDDVLYLRDIGVPDGVVAAMMRRGAEIRQQQAEVAVLQTNLVSAVAEIKAALANRGDIAASNGVPAGVASEAPPAPEGAGTAVASVGTPGPAPLPQATAAVPPDAPPEVQPFYDTLSPYGSWYQVPSYGWVWQPSVVVVNTGWSPYCHGGRWVWSDWGWYWSSEYSWGWAPFHYGRWATYPGLGWCWVPGTVWGPSWVTWRSHGTYVGWAPLPPACGWVSGVGLTWHGSGISVGFGFGLAPSCYTFVSYGNFCHRNVAHHALRSDHATTVYNNSTVVNNVINGNNNTIVNNGVGYEAVASRTRTEIPKARIEPLPSSVDAPVRVDRMERSKDGLVVYRPTPVSEVGGRPTALRAEARPVSTGAAGFVAGPTATPGARSASIPTRPSQESRFATVPGSSGPKGLESRGVGTSSGGRASVGVPSAMDARPASGRPTPSVAPSRSPMGTVGAAGPKAVEGRSNPSGSFSSTPSSPGGAIGPTRQTTPVPLSDPSRYLPRGASPVPRTAAPTAPTAKTAVEGRSSAVIPQTVQPRSGYTPSASPTPNVARPGTASPYATPAAPRTMAPQAGPKVDYSRPAVGGGYSPNATRAPMAAPSAPASRGVYSAPSPAAGIPSGARPSYSAPTPTMSAPVAPRPSISAPSPAVSAPRPTISAPSPAGPSPAGRSPSSGGRSQPN